MDGVKWVGAAEIVFAIGISLSEWFHVILRLMTNSLVYSHLMAKANTKGILKCYDNMTMTSDDMAHTRYLHILHLHLINYMSG